MHDVVDLYANVHTLISSLKTLTEGKIKMRLSILRSNKHRILNAQGSCFAADSKTFKT